MGLAIGVLAGTWVMDFVAWTLPRIWVTTIPLGFILFVAPLDVASHFGWTYDNCFSASVVVSFLPLFYSHWRDLRRLWKGSPR
jgi:hypothetical protein